MFVYLEEQFQMAMICPQVPMPDFSNVPEYFEEIVPVKIRYEGTIEEWNKVIKLIGEKRILAEVSAVDGTVRTLL